MKRHGAPQIIIAYGIFHKYRFQSFFIVTTTAFETRLRARLAIKPGSQGATRPEPDRTIGDCDQRRDMTFFFWNKPVGSLDALKSALYRIFRLKPRINRLR